MYYRTSLMSDVEFSLGTSAVRFITVFFSRIIDASFIGTFLFYNILGFIGLLAFDSSLRAAAQGQGKLVQRFVTVVVLLPSVSFWSAAIGKDSIAFMAASLALWASLNFNSRYKVLIFSIVVMLVVRPHIAALLVGASAISIIFSSSVNFSQRVMLGGGALAGGLLIFPVVLAYGGLADGVDVDQVSSYIEHRQGYNLDGGGGIDISSMPLPMQLFTYMFRPLPYEAFSALSLAASLDNLLILFLFLAGIYSYLAYRRSYPFNNAVFLWAYAISAWLMLGTTSSNLGISVRQKWMFAPMLIFLIFSVLGRVRVSTNFSPKLTSQISTRVK